MHTCFFYVSCENSDHIWVLIKPATALLAHKTNLLRKSEPGEILLSGSVLSTIWLHHFWFCIRSPRAGVIESSNLRPNCFINSLASLMVYILPCMVLLRIGNRPIIQVHNICRNVKTCQHFLEMDPRFHFG